MHSIWRAQAHSQALQKPHTWWNRFGTDLWIRQFVESNTLMAFCRKAALVKWKHFPRTSHKSAGMYFFLLLFQVLPTLLILLSHQNLYLGPKQWQSRSCAIQLCAGRESRGPDARDFGVGTARSRVCGFMHVRWSRCHWEAPSALLSLLCDPAINAH